LADYIGRREGSYDMLWFLSRRHDFLRGLEAGGLTHLYTKNNPEQADGFRTKEQFVSDIERALKG
jgi:hypothetical protein